MPLSPCLLRWANVVDLCRLLANFSCPKASPLLLWRLHPKIQHCGEMVKADKKQLNLTATKLGKACAALRRNSAVRSVTKHTVWAQPSDDVQAESVKGVCEFVFGGGVQCEFRGCEHKPWLLFTGLLFFFGSSWAPFGRLVSFGSSQKKKVKKSHE